MSILAIKDTRSGRYVSESAWEAWEAGDASEAHLTGDIMRAAWIVLEDVPTGMDRSRWSLVSVAAEGGTQ